MGHFNTSALYDHHRMTFVILKTSAELTQNQDLNTHFVGVNANVLQRRLHLRWPILHMFLVRQLNLEFVLKIAKAYVTCADFCFTQYNRLIDTFPDFFDVGVQSLKQAIDGLFVTYTVSLQNKATQHIQKSCFSQIA